jgi:hypothetical protein
MFAREISLIILYPTIVMVQRVWYLYEVPSSSKSSSISQQYIQSLVDEVVLKQYFSDTTLTLGDEASLYHFVSHPFQPMVEEVVSSMQSSANPTSLLGSDESIKVVSPMQYLADTTLISRSDVGFKYVFIISSSVPSEQGENPFSSSTLPPSARMVSFDWNDLVEPCLPSYAPL